MKFEDLNPRGYDLDLKTECYLRQLLEAVNALEAAYGENFVVTSGLRSTSFQNALIATGKSHATKSRHVIGAAADIADPAGKLAAWCKANEETLEKVGIWCEEPFYTKGWVHMQILPPGSGKRFFVP